MLRRVVIFCAAALLLIAIAGTVQLGQVDPTVALSLALLAGPPAIPTPTPAASDEPSPRGGLGNSRKDVEAAFGLPTGLQGTMIAYRDGQYAATYADGRATAILVSFADSPRTLAVARKATHAYIPDDSRFIGTLSAGPSRIADVYQSARLGARVAPIGGTPRGQFAVVYETTGPDAVKDVLFIVGQIPQSS
ncbi:MAG TPA: hypothetical protein VNL16_09740 [Chloroflexota bacterium]|nr:hypothetical protein [Chloroflexota bacterium]